MAFWSVSLVGLLVMAWKNAVRLCFVDKKLVQGSWLKNPIKTLLLWPRLNFTSFEFLVKSRAFLKKSHGAIVKSCQFGYKKNNSGPGNLNFQNKLSRSVNPRCIEKAVEHIRKRLVIWPLCYYNVSWTNDIHLDVLSIHNYFNI